MMMASNLSLDFLKNLINGEEGWGSKNLWVV